MKVETLQSIVNNDVTPFAEMLEEVILLAKKTKTFTGKTVDRPKGAFLTVVRGNFFMRIPERKSPIVNLQSGFYFAFFIDGSEMF